VKPFDRGRFSDALERARKQIERDDTRDIGRRLLALVNYMRCTGPRCERRVVKSRRRAVPARRRDRLNRDIRNYVRLHVGSTSHLLRETSAAFRRARRKSFRIQPVPQ
jgi:hypothetical protein